jgi:hypothetical protein
LEKKSNFGEKTKKKKGKLEKEMQKKKEKEKTLIFYKLLLSSTVI